MDNQLDSAREPLLTESVTKKDQWVAFWIATNEPIFSKSGSLGTYIPVWDNPMSAHEWAQAQSRYAKNNYYVREVEMLFLAKRE